LLLIPDAQKVCKVNENETRRYVIDSCFP